MAFILHTVAEKLAVVHKLHRRSIGVVLYEALIEIWKAILCMNKLLELGTVSAGHPLTTKVSPEGCNNSMSMSIARHFFKKLTDFHGVLLHAVFHVNILCFKVCYALILFMSAFPPPEFEEAGASEAG